MLSASRAGGDGQAVSGGPLLDTVPPDGRFAGEYARTYSCDSGFGNGGGGSLTGPGFAEVGKRYNTPAAYTYDDLRRQFDQPARAAGWVNDPGRTYPEAGHLGYCRQVGNRLVHARVGSTDRTAWIEGSPGSGIEGSCQRADACEAAATLKISRRRCGFLKAKATSRHVIMPGLAGGDCPTMKVSLLHQTPLNRPLTMNQLMPIEIGESFDRKSNPSHQSNCRRCDDPFRFPANQKPAGANQNFQPRESLRNIGARERKV